MNLAEATSPSQKMARIDGVDLLRGLAILLVLLNHVNIRLVLAHVPYASGLPRQLVDSLFWSGQSGVQMFFAISGFLITATTIRRWGSVSRVSVRGFYVMRFARIAPLLLLLLAVLSVLHTAGLEDFVVKSKTGGLARALFAALTFHVNVLEARRGYLPGNWDVLWSLSVEEMFYLFFPLVARLLGRGKFMIVLLFGFVALGPYARAVLANGNEVWHEYSYLGSMDAIAMGCLTALLATRVQFSRRGLWTSGSLGAGLLVFTLGFSLQTAQWGLDRSGLTFTILAIGTCMLVAVSAQTQWKSPWVLGPIREMGQRSYEVYLTHMFVVFALFNLFVRYGKPMKAVPVLFVAVIAIAGLFGAVVARLFSEPMNRYLRARWADWH